MNALTMVKVRCRGTHPILFNRMDEGTLMAIWNKEKPPKNQARPTPRDACESKIYKDDKSCFIPINALFSCLVNAGRSIRLDGKRQMSTADSTMLPAFITLNDNLLRLLDPNTSKPITAYEVDMRLGRNPNGGEAVCVCRPRIDSWMFEVNVTVDLREIGIDKIRELFDIAGARIGLLDFRPQCKGLYGTFVVDCWEEQVSTNKKAA